MQGFEYRNIISEFCHISGKRETSWTRTDNSNLNTILLFNYRNTNMSTFPFKIGSKTFQMSDSYRLMIHFQMNTFGFTLFLLRTNTTTDSRQCTCLFQNSSRFKEFASFDVLDKRRNVYSNRATFHTRRVGTIQTSFGFCLCLFQCQTLVYLF